MLMVADELMMLDDSKVLVTDGEAIALLERLLLLRDDEEDTEMLADIERVSETVLEADLDGDAEINEVMVEVANTVTVVGSATTKGRAVTVSGMMPYGKVSRPWNESV
jgi:hypothetical protein